MDQIQEFLPIIIPITILEVGLMLYALIHILKHNQYKVGNRILWIILVVLFQIIGPILYLTIGKEDE